MVDQARYALICQSEGLVPIVEPDLVLAGTHTLEDAVEVNVRVSTASSERWPRTASTSTAASSR